MTSPADETMMDSVLDIAMEQLYFTFFFSLFLKTFCSSHLCEFSDFRSGTFRFFADNSILFFWEGGLGGRWTSRETVFGCGVVPWTDGCGSGRIEGTVTAWTGPLRALAAIVCIREVVAVVSTIIETLVIKE